MKSSFKQRLFRAAALTLTMIFALSLVSCVKRGASGDGGFVCDNIARVYDKANNTSRFVLNNTLIEGDVDGKAYLDASARGRTTLAWTYDTTLYFVSENGIDFLGDGVTTAEISFDGRLCVYLIGNELRCYFADTRTSSVIDSGMEAIRQISISPNSKRVMYTTIPNDASADQTRIWDGNTITDYYAQTTSMAISDDGQTIYYMSTADNSFCVEHDGAATLISDSVTSTSSFNFTRDLSEVTFDEGGQNVLYRLSDKSKTDLGGGFGFTEKTDVYSISTVTLYTYINDCATFTDGLWMARSRDLTDQSTYLYDIAYIDKNGDIEKLVTSAADYQIVRADNSIYWQSGTELYRTTINGKTVRLAKNVSVKAFAVTKSGKYAYCLSDGGVLYSIKGKTVKKLASSVTSMAAIEDRLAYVCEPDGDLYFAEGTDCTYVMSGANDIDRRAGMLICFADGGDSGLYDAYFSIDGKSYILLQSGVER